MVPARLLSCLAAVLLLALGLSLAGCGDDGDEGAGTGAEATTGTTEPEPSGATGCRRVRAPKPKAEQDRERPRLRLDRARTFDARIVTNCGEFTIRLDVRDQPRTAASFTALARDGFYDGTTFHRIVPGFVIQGGDPAGDGSGGPGYSVVEAPPRGARYPRDTVAMAKTEQEAPGTSGSQFYVVTAADAQLPPEYAILGRVVEGRDVVQRIGVLPADPETEQPLEPVVIQRVTVEER